MLLFLLKFSFVFPTPRSRVYSVLFSRTEGSEPEDDTDEEGLSLCDIRIVDSVVLQKGMVLWKQSGSLLHILRFVGDPMSWAPRDAKGLVRFGTA